MTELINLLDDIAKNITFHSAISDYDEEEIRKIADSYFQKFKLIYARIDRHRYSEITKYIDNELQDTVDFLKHGMYCIIECAQKNEYDKEPKDSDDYKCYSKINKLSDHIELEVSRYSSIKKIQLIADTHTKQEKDVLELLSKTEDTLNETQERAKNLSQQLISILGIFAGLIITFSFATTIAGEVVVNIIKSDILYIGFIICVLGMIFMNLIAFLMSFVTKLSGHRFSTTFPWLIYILGNFIILALTIFLYCNMK